MPTIDRKALLKALKSDPPRAAYYLTGPEDLLKDDLEAAIVRAALPAEAEGFDLDRTSAAKLDAEAVETACNAMPMFAERRAVVIRDVEQWRANARGRKALLAYLERPSPSTVLILVQGSGDPEPDDDIAARTAHVHLDHLDVESAVKAALDHAKKHGVTLEEAAARHLVRAVQTEQGIDLGALRMEVDKLGALPPDVRVTAELVGSLVGVRHGETPDDWLDAALRRDTPRALRLLGPVLAASSGVRLAMLLGTGLLGVQMARALLDNPKRSGSVERAVFEAIRTHRLFGIGDWKETAALWSAAAERWTGRELARAVRLVLETDIRLKQTTIDDDAALLRTLLLQLAPRPSQEQAA